MASPTENEALRCILLATSHLATPTDEFKQTGSAVSLIASGDDETPHGKECVRATNLAVGNDGWQRDGKRRKEREVWAVQMRDTVKNTFRKKCGVEATLEGSSFANLEIERLSSNKKVFYEGKDGTGSHVRVLCGGQITMRSAGRSTSTMMAKTWNQQANDQDEVQCLQACAAKNKVCLEHNKNITVAECRNACMPSCS